MSVSQPAGRPLSDPDERVYSPLEKYQRIFPDAVKPAPIYMGPKLSAIVFEMLPGQVHQPHKHDDQTQMWIIISGQGEVLLEDGRTELVGPGAVCVHHPTQLHGIKTVGDENLVYITVADRGART